MARQYSYMLVEKKQLTRNCWCDSRKSYLQSDLRVTLRSVHKESPPGPPLTEHEPCRNMISTLPEALGLALTLTGRRQESQTASSGPASRRLFRIGYFGIYEQAPPGTRHVTVT